MAKKRFFEKRDPSLKGSGYDSLLEKRLHETSLKAATFHPKDMLVHYSVPHTYEVDFIYEKDGKRFFIETKGRFHDSNEARKYTFVRDNLKEGEELIFIFDKETTAFPFAKKRKDGTKRSHAEWAIDQGFRFWNKNTFSLEYL